MTISNRDNSGTLGKAKERTHENSPEYKGKASIDGAEYWVSGWVKQNSQTGERFFSLSFQKIISSEQYAEKRHDEQVFDDDIPF